MSLFDKLFGYVKEVTTLAHQVEALSRETQRLAEETRDIDRRLVRLETLIELAQQRRLGSPTDRGT